MNWLFLTLGILVTIWAIIEGLWTALWVDGNSAPLTSRLTSLCWKTSRAVIGSKQHRLLSLSGPTILALTVSLWIIFIGIGWSLIFYAVEGSIKSTSSNVVPDYSDVLWYTAYTMFTVGNGDFSPTTDLWQVLSSLVAFSGMMMVTLSVTYILQVISALTNKRSFASQVTSISKSAEELVIAQWNDHDFGAMELYLSNLSSQLSRLSEQHLAYPILHYYHAASFEKSTAFAIAILDDALSLIAFGVEKEHQPSSTNLQLARESVSSFLKTLKSAFIQPADHTPKAPDLQRLKDAGVPVISSESFYKKLEELENRRKLLLSTVNNGAWHWPP